MKCVLANRDDSADQIDEDLRHIDALRQNGRAAEAEAACESYIAQNGPVATAIYRLGLLHRDAGRDRLALDAFSHAGRDANGPVNAALEAGLLLNKLGYPKEARGWIVYAIKRAPNHGGGHFSLGHLLALNGQFNEAIPAYRKALLHSQGHLGATRGLAEAYLATHRFEDAERAAIALRQLAPRDAEALLLLGRIYAEQNKFDQAAETIAHIDESGLITSAQLCRAAELLTLVDHHTAAIALLERAAEWIRDKPELVLTLGKAFKEVGKFDSARDAFIRAIDLDPSNSRAYFELADIHQFVCRDPLVARMESTLAAHDESEGGRINLHFALGKAYDDIGDTERAFANFHAANSAAKRRLDYNEDATLGAMKKVAVLFSSDTMERLRNSGPKSSQPIFIVGMPRSGSTLVEQILAAHPDVIALGETDQLRRSLDSVLAELSLTANSERDISTLTGPELARIGEDYLKRTSHLARGRSHIVDKQLANTSSIGLINLALPHAKIINCMRDPVDTCLSCYTKPFGLRLGSFNDLASLGRYYRQHTALMDHWRRVLPSGVLLDISYERLIADFNDQSRRILQYCSLDWDERCRHFYRASRPVRTASAYQVRQPIFTSSIRRSARYRPLLGPLIDALGDLAGYSPDDTPSLASGP